MNYGLYLSASGALHSLFRQDLYANNLANADTIGFKPDIAFARQRDPARLEALSFEAASADPQWMLERMGGGLLGEPVRVRLAQGDLVPTGNDLDVALQGDGFLVVQDDRSGQRLLTRDGRLTLDGDRRLVLASSGWPVLDADNRPITLDPSASIAIDARGAISQNGRAIARLQVARPADPAALEKVGHSLLRIAHESPESLLPGNGEVVQGHVESSATDPIMTLNDMINASKAVQANAQMMQYHDHVMGMAVNTFGRIA
jgi:flagellar basal body rod protein FlgG